MKFTGKPFDDRDLVGLYQDFLWTLKTLGLVSRESAVRGYSIAWDRHMP